MSDTKLQPRNGLTYGQTVVQIIQEMITEMNKPNTRQMRNQNKFMFVRMMGHKFRDLKQTSPTLFEKVIEDHPNFDLKRLMTMMGVSDRVSNNEMSYEDASKYIGNKYYKEFVEPNIELPSAEPTITEVDDEDNDNNNDNNNDTTETKQQQ
jgi:hypothetical protein